MADCRQLKVEIAQLLKQGHLKEFLLKRRKAVLDKGKREDTPPPQTLRIVNTIFGGLDINGLIVSATSAYIWRVNLVILEYEASNPNYNYSLAFSSHEIQRLHRPHNDALVISLNVTNVLL